MVIKEERPVTLREVYDLVKDNERGEEVKNFLKKFIKLNSKKSEELKKELKELALIKLKEIHIVKIIDFLPSNSIELNKILTDVSLDEEEISKILNVVKKY